jgi:phage portal protein BeeE
MQQQKTGERGDPMNPFTRLFHPRTSPAWLTISMNGSAYAFFMGVSSSGKHVNERSAMQMTAVYSCVRILSEAVAGLPAAPVSVRSRRWQSKSAGSPAVSIALTTNPTPK